MTRTRKRAPACCSPWLNWRLTKKGSSRSNSIKTHGSSSTCSTGKVPPASTNPALWPLVQIPGMDRNEVLDEDKAALPSSLLLSDRTCLDNRLPERQGKKEA